MLKRSQAEDDVGVSIVIPVRDRWAEAWDCLTILARQKEIARCEVIVVDDGSRTRAPQGLVRPSFPYRLSLVRHAVPLGIAAARNTGMAAAHGSAILFIDSDCQPAPDFLPMMMAALEQYPGDKAFQAGLTGGTHSLAQRIEALRLTVIQQFRQTSTGTIDYLNTSGFAIRNHDGNKADLFNPGVDRGEDSLLLAELKARGQVPRFVPRAVVRHCPRLTLGRYLLKHFRIGYDNGYAHERLRDSRSLLGMSERLAAFRWIWRKAKTETHGWLVFALAMMAYALECCGRVAHRLIGMHPGRMTLLSAIVDPVSGNELLARILSAAQKQEGLAVTYLTSWSLVLAGSLPSFGRMLQSFDICYADSIGVGYSAFLTKLRRVKKVTANVFFYDLCKESANRGLTMALIGTHETIVRQVAAQLTTRIQTLRIVLCSTGYLSRAEELALEARLREAKPDIVVIGRGQPIQEEWALNCRRGMPKTVFLCVGGLFDYLAGAVRQTPEWIRRLGFEWLHRFVHHPRRYWRIYVYGIPALGGCILRHYFSSLFSIVGYLGKSEK